MAGDVLSLSAALHPLAFPQLSTVEEGSSQGVCDRWLPVELLTGGSRAVHKTKSTYSGSCHLATQMVPGPNPKRHEITSYSLTAMARSWSRRETVEQQDGPRHQPCSSD